MQTAGAPKRRLRIGGILYSLWAVTDYNRWDAASNEEWGAQWQKQRGERPEEYNLEGVSGWKAKLRSSGVF